MNEDITPPRPSALLRHTSLCLSLLGSICLCVAGSMMIRWSLKYAGAGKFTIIGGLAIVVGLVLAALQLKKIFGGRSESNQPSQPIAGKPGSG